MLSARSGTCLTFVSRGLNVGKKSCLSLKKQKGKEQLFAVPLVKSKREIY